MQARRRIVAVSLVASAAIVMACGARTGLSDRPQGERCAVLGASRPCKSACGTGTEACINGVWTGCTAPASRAPPERIVLDGTVRDLRDTHPDFESAIGDDRTIVETLLGSDDAPVYAGRPITATTHGREAFDAWYHDAPGTNARTPFAIELRRSGGVYAFEGAGFFPIDGKLFGNEGRAHNYHFTYELHSVFEYRGGETLTFSGDDDLWIFIDRKLAINLGGVHSSQTASVDLDQLGLERALVHRIDLFFAERHTTSSEFHIQTTIAGFDPCR